VAEHDENLLSVLDGHDFVDEYILEMKSSKLGSLATVSFALSGNSLVILCKSSLLGPCRISDDLVGKSL